ncbi:uncharacterized protein J3D65DRAFT_622576 [Phyllosticta citribraziliensis]|uniref:Uncharacterized protein n=1 Tax=Phyllosticta citribraziliensis TaxID=989973 RepID=A0ABR1LTW3_9PEZI
MTQPCRQDSPMSTASPPPFPHPLPPFPRPAARSQTFLPPMPPTPACASIPWQQPTSRACWHGILPSASDQPPARPTPCYLIPGFDSRPDVRTGHRQASLGTPHTPLFFYDHLLDSKRRHLTRPSFSSRGSKRQGSGKTQDQLRPRAVYALVTVVAPNFTPLPSPLSLITSYGTQYLSPPPLVSSRLLRPRYPVVLARPSRSSPCLLSFSACFPCLHVRVAPPDPCHHASIHRPFGYSLSPREYHSSRTSPITHPSLLATRHSLVARSRLSRSA